ncbi:hypothetical protein I0C86_30595 [Plantactinospora sp. S1510]|uniref:Integral membrane protein n=1 Tax=Plantactinospora alkalitolerans TaxID=2789879 RepID=A0ABS0H499_9ACTN|nr:hypothetical protein [Plantactinospora alkalitolerans]MBF9133280.1 hypothetical protein [Plantactinospora alkalitolerans]
MPPGSGNPTGHEATPRALTMLHWAFACFALLNVVLLLNGSGLVVLRTAALVGYSLAAGLSVSAALRGPERSRRVTIVLHLAMAVLQFVFSIPVLIALLGIPLSIAILARSRPQFPRMSPRTRKIWLVLHVGFSVGWLGVALTMTVLAIIGSATASHTMRHGAYELLHVVDFTAAIPSMFLSIITGLVVSLGTKWGLVRYRWVIVKFAISVSIPLLAGTLESALADELALRTVDPAGEPGGTALALTACLATFTVALWVATILSVVKPWSRTRWGRAADARERQQRRRRVEHVPEPTAIG